MLVERAGQTVSKEELFAHVWSGAEVEDNNLTQSISTLRKALGEKRGENRYIVTDPGRGYRFVAPVSRVVEEAAVSSNGLYFSEPLVEAQTYEPRRTKLLALVAVTVLIATGLAVCSALQCGRPCDNLLRFCECVTCPRPRRNPGCRRAYRKC
jgi:DNA-binding winged helix-turn-helix (wHTH) protein